MPEEAWQSPWAVPVAILVVGVFAGLVLQRLIIARLRRAAGRTTWKGDDVIVDSLGYMPFAWCVGTGLYAAARTLPMSTSHLALVDKVLLSAAILSATIVVSRIVGGLVRIRTERAGGDLAAATALVTTIVRALVVVTGLLVLFQTLGIEIAPVLATLGIGGLAVALALQDTLANLFAGLYIVLARRTRKGDYIRLDTGEEGYVTEITWRDTSVLMLSNDLVVIPNKNLAAAIVTNYDQPDPETGIRVQVAVAYDSDLERVEAATVDVARRVLQDVPGGVRTFEPFVRYHTFGDSGVGFTVILRAKRLVDQHLLKHEFVKRLHARYAKDGIRIPFPTRTVEIVGGGVAGR